MTRTRVLIALGFTVLAVSIAWVLFVGLPRWTAKPTPQPEEPRTATVAEPEPAPETDAEPAAATDAEQPLAAADEEA